MSDEDDEDAVAAALAALADEGSRSRIPAARRDDGLDELRKDTAINNTETGGGWQHTPSWDGPAPRRNRGR